MIVNPVIAPSLYAQYLAERCGRAILETSEGYATYVIQVPDVYIADIFVLPDARRRGVASAMADTICAEAKGHGCTRLIGSIDPMTHGAHESLLVLLSYGMRLSHTGNGLIFFQKALT